MAKGFWFNSYAGFEQKQNRANRLMLNFYYLCDDPKEIKTVKTFVNEPVIIPSKFIFKDDLDKILQDLKNIDNRGVKLYLAKQLTPFKEDLEKNPGLEVVVTENNNFSVLNLIKEKDPKLIKDIDKEQFQKGNFDKILRLNGFYPEQKVELIPEFERAFELTNNFNGEKEKEEEINFLLKKVNPKNDFFFDEEKKKNILYLDSRDGIKFTGKFLTGNEFNSMWYGDIEKPLWKNPKEKLPGPEYLPNEKDLIKRREEVLKEKASVERLILKGKNIPASKIQELEHIIHDYEEKLTLEPKNAEWIKDVEGEKVKLFDKKYDARVSWFASIFKLPSGTKIKEVDVFDPLNEIIINKINDFDVIKHTSEEELINSVRIKAKKRRPLSFVGYNLVYDITQSRMAAKKEQFDIGVDDISPRRDFVRYFYQRMKEDMIYIDLMRQNILFYPYLKLKINVLQDGQVVELPRGHTLEKVCQFHNINFKKKMNYPTQRKLEILRFSGKTKDIRLDSTQQIAEYSADDVPPLEEMLEKLPFISLLVKLKNIMPYCTYTELGFAPTVVSKYIDKQHWDRCHNQRFFNGRSRKKHEDRIQIAKKRIPALKKEYLKENGIKALPLGKEETERVYKKVQMLYMPLEEWILPALRRAYPEFYYLHKETKVGPLHFASLQYIKSLEREMLVDWYFSTRENDTFKDSIDKLKIKREEVREFEKTIETEKLGKLYRGYEELKNHYRSVYVHLKGSDRKLIREKTDSNQFLEGFDYAIDKDLYLLKEKSDEIKDMLDDKYKSELKRYVSLFKNHEQIVKDIVEKTNFEDKSKIKNLVYILNQKKRAENASKEFYARYRIDYGSITNRVKSYYKNLSKNLNDLKAPVVRITGDYLFISSEQNLSFDSNLLIPLREFSNMVVDKEGYKENIDTEDILNQNYEE